MNSTHSENIHTVLEKKEVEIKKKKSSKLQRDAMDLKNNRIFKWQSTTKQAKRSVQKEDGREYQQWQGGRGAPIGRSNANDYQQSYGRNERGWNYQGEHGRKEKRWGHFDHKGGTNQGRPGYENHRRYEWSDHTGAHGFNRKEIDTYEEQRTPPWRNHRERGPITPKYRQQRPNMAIQEPITPFLGKSHQNGWLHNTNRGGEETGRDVQYSQKRKRSQ